MALGPPGLRSSIMIFVFSLTAMARKALHNSIPTWRCSWKPFRSSTNPKCRGTWNFGHMIPLLLELYWLLVKFQLQFSVLVVTIETRHGIGSYCLCNCLFPVVFAHSIRSGRVAMPWVHSVKQCHLVWPKKHAFLYQYLSMELPPSAIQMPPNLLAFWKVLKTCFFP